MNFVLPYTPHSLRGRESRRDPMIDTDRIKLYDNLIIPIPDGGGIFKMDPKKLENKIPIGWREWISLPEWGVEYIKVKVDTGARTSSLHVDDLDFFEKDGESWVRFSISPWQRSHMDQVRVEAKVISQRDVRSSSGYLEKRPVVATGLIVAGRSISGEVTLTNRDKMGFRMLLGREAIRNVFSVVPGLSYLGGKPPSEIRKLNNRRTRSRS